MRNLILIPIIFLLLTGCKKENNDNDSDTFSIKGKWFTSGEESFPGKAIRSTEVLEFGDNTYEMVYNEKMVALPDCTLIYKFKRIVNSDYSVYKGFIKFTNMKSDTNGVVEYSGKTNYMVYLYTVGGKDLFLGHAEVWQQLSGTNGQLKDGLFYQLDSSGLNQQDTIKYHHYKLEFFGDSLEYRYLTNNTPERPAENEHWDIKYYESRYTDSTFVCGYPAKYQFIDGLMISHGRLVGDNTFYSPYPK